MRIVVGVTFVDEKVASDRHAQWLELALDRPHVECFFFAVLLPPAWPLGAWRAFQKNVKCVRSEMPPRARRKAKACKAQGARTRSGTLEDSCLTNTFDKISPGRAWP